MRDFLACGRVSRRAVGGTGGAPAVAARRRILAPAATTSPTSAPPARATGGSLHQRALRHGNPALPTLAGPGDAAGFVAARVAEGADCIKVYLEDPRWFGHPGLSPATVQAVVKAAHAHGRIAIAHAGITAMAAMFSDAGGDALAHVHPRPRPPVPGPPGRMRGVRHLNAAGLRGPVRRARQPGRRRTPGPGRPPPARPLP